MIFIGFPPTELVSATITVAYFEFVDKLPTRLSVLWCFGPIISFHRHSLYVIPHPEKHFRISCPKKIGTLPKLRNKNGLFNEMLSKIRLMHTSFLPLLYVPVVENGCMATLQRPTAKTKKQDTTIFADMLDKLPAIHVLSIQA